MAQWVVGHLVRGGCDTRDTDSIKFILFSSDDFLLLFFSFSNLSLFHVFYDLVSGIVYTYHCIICHRGAGENDHSCTLSTLNK